LTQPDLSLFEMKVTLTSSLCICLALLSTFDLLAQENYGVDSYYFHYPVVNDLMISRASLLEDRPGCTFQFAVGAGVETVLLIAMDSGHYETLAQIGESIKARTTPASDSYIKHGIDVPLTIEFQDKGSSKLQIWNLDVVIKKPDVEKHFRLSLTYYPKEFYIKNGNSLSRRIILSSADLYIANSSLDDWINIDTTPSDIEFARKKWGPLIQGVKGNHNKASILLRNFIDELNPSIGVPSDSINQLHPFDMHTRILKGKDQVWCTNQSLIFVVVCNSLGIPARILATGKTMTNANTMLWVNDGHTTTEIFDDLLNKWVWMDMGLEILGVTDFKDHYLDLTQLCYMMNDRMAIDRLSIVQYKGGRIRKIKFNNFERRSILTDYFGKNQNIYYHPKSVKFQYPARVVQE
jgi:hypothetical protein